MTICRGTRPGGIKCDQTAVYVVDIKCKTCPLTGTYEVCTDCADMARRGEVHGCAGCGKPKWGIEVKRIQTLVSA